MTDPLLELHKRIDKKVALATRVAAVPRDDYLAPSVRAALQAAAQADPINDFSSCDCDYHSHGVEVGDSLVASVVWRPAPELPYLLASAFRGETDLFSFEHLGSQKKNQLAAL